MKYLVAVATLAAVVASPAFAQSYDPSIGSGNLNAWPYRASPPALGNTGYEAQAQVPRVGRPQRAPVRTPHSAAGQR